MMKEDDAARVEPQPETFNEFIVYQMELPPVFCRPKINK